MLRELDSNAVKLCYLPILLFRTCLFQANGFVNFFILPKRERKQAVVIAALSADVIFFF